MTWRARLTKLLNVLALITLVAAVLETTAMIGTTMWLNDTANIDTANIWIPIGILLGCTSILASFGCSFLCIRLRDALEPDHVNLEEARPLLNAATQDQDAEIPEEDKPFFAELYGDEKPCYKHGTKAYSQQLKILTNKINQI